MKEKKLYIFIAIITTIFLFATAALCNQCRRETEEEVSGKIEELEEEIEELKKQLDEEKIGTEDEIISAEVLNIGMHPVASEGGWIEEARGVTYNGPKFYIGDSSNDGPCRAYISFDITKLSGATIESATLTFNLSRELGNPTFIEKFCIDEVYWGKRKIISDDCYLEGHLIEEYIGPNVNCKADNLKTELQKAIDDKRPRFQIRIRHSGELTDGDGATDGWLYKQSGINLDMNYIP